MSSGLPLKADIAQYSRHVSKVPTEADSCTATNGPSFDHLVDLGEQRRRHRGITAGVISDTVGAPHNSLSSHLAILVRAGLLRSARDGRTIVYRSDVNGMRSLISFLINDCCNGHPELCGLLGIDAGAERGCAPTTKKATSKKRVVRTRRLADAR